MEVLDLLPANRFAKVKAIAELNDVPDANRIFLCFVKDADNPSLFFAEKFAWGICGFKEPIENLYIFRERAEALEVQCAVPINFNPVLREAVDIVFERAEQAGGDCGGFHRYENIVTNLPRNVNNKMMKFHTFSKVLKINRLRKHT